MNLREVQRVLLETYRKELTDGKRRHVVFWYDENGEFLDDIEELELEGIRKWVLTPSNYFATKYELEKVDSASHFLIYANMAKPGLREDWLIDVYKYSYEFATDKTTVMMRELGVTDDGLRPVFQKYAKFFNARGRFAAFQSYGLSSYTEEIVDLAVLASICKAKDVSIDEVVKVLFAEHTVESKKSWESIQKFGAEEAFWSLVEKGYGYHLEEKSLESLLLFFMITAVSEAVSATLPRTWLKYVSARPANCTVFINQFANHPGTRESFQILSDRIKNTIKVEEYTIDWDIQEYVESDLFRSFDEAIISYIAGQLLEDIHQYSSYLELISKRRKLYWFQTYENEYEALQAAVLLLQQVYEMDHFIAEQGSYEMFRSYVNEYYKIDMYYRKFYTYFDRLEQTEHLQTVRERVENLYVNWFLDELSIKWSNVIEQELTQHWPIPALEQQHKFYDHSIQSFVQKDERVFVIISDALRFEAAKELVDVLNKERKGSTELSYMQGVLPSYTDLGMIALLPYKKLELIEKEERNAEVYVNGLRAASTETRDQVLKSVISDSLAISYKEVSSISNRQELREKLQGKKLVYIYHNVIDARGDNAATEREVFEAVEKALKEIRLLVAQLVNGVSATNIVVTADHGFIYNRDPLQASDKIIKRNVEADVEKRRFIISNDNSELEGTITFSLDYVLGEETGKKVIVPRGSNRFAVQGTGVNYVHGGAMLQEIVVPIVRVKADRSKSGKNDIRKVEVKLTSVTRKVTNMITYLEFFQVEKVEGKKKPLRLKLYFTDGEGNRISNENILIADSQSSNPEERTFKEKFVLKSMVYNKEAKYYLVLEDEQESVENMYEKIPFTIDIAITNDFGF